jgi:hypothetical protein
MLQDVCPRQIGRNGLSCKPFAQDTGRLQECFNSTKRGCTMPAFTFEKISPPENRGPIPPIANKKQRGVVVKILDRFVEARVKRSLKKGVIARNPHRAPERAPE